MIFIGILILLSLFIPILWPMTIMAILVYVCMGRMIWILGLGALWFFGCRMSNEPPPQQEPVVPSSYAQYEDHELEGVTVSDTGLPIVDDGEQPRHTMDTGPLSHGRGW